MPDQTLRRRRGQTSSRSAPRTTSEPSRTTSEQTEPPTEQQRERKTVAQLVDDEEKSFSQFLSICGIVLMIFLYMIRKTEFPQQRRVYAVMIDAGSTGTRAQIFKFVHDKELNKLVLNGSEIHQIPKSIAVLGMGVGGTGTQFFRQLLDKVKKSVPGMRRRKRTPILLRATAGLRLLGPEAAERALGESRKALNASDFYFKEEFASILSAKDEGVFAWTTVNYLLGNLDGFDKDGNPRAPVATLELGGASMQIVHTVDNDKDNDQGDGDDAKVRNKLQKHDLALFGRKYTLRTASHLGLGLIDFTKRLYQLFESEGVLEEGNPCFRKGKQFTEKSLRLGVEGSEVMRVVSLVGDGDFDRCVASAQIAIATFLNSEGGVGQLPKGAIAYAFAYFYDRTVGLGVDKRAKKDALIAKGRELCEAGADRAISGEFDEACLEFSYVYAILKMITEDFSDERGVSVVFEQYVEGHMLGWALGAVLDVIEPVVNWQVSLDDEPLLMI